MVCVNDLERQEKEPDISPSDNPDKHSMNTSYGFVVRLH